MGNWPKTSELVEVCWLDSNGTSGWSNESAAIAEANECYAMMVKSCGYLLKMDPAYVLICLSVAYTTHGSVGDVLQIPRSSVSSITQLISNGDLLSPDGKPVA